MPDLVSGICFLLTRFTAAKMFCKSLPVPTIFVLFNLILNNYFCYEPLDGYCAELFLYSQGLVFGLRILQFVRRLIALSLVNEALSV